MSGQPSAPSGPPPVARGLAARVDPRRSTRRPSPLYRKSAATFRWLHIYLSMLGFAAMMFFSLTGITLNHPTWFGGSETSVRDDRGRLPHHWLADPVRRLEVVEQLRSRHSLRGRVAEFEISEYDVMVVFKSPGYAADLFVDRETGDYTLTESASGLVGVMNDLHKGRDAGAAWSILIDVSAVVLTLFSLSGFGLLFYLKRRRVTGTLTAVAGMVALVAVWALLVR